MTHSFTYLTAHVVILTRKQQNTILILFVLIDTMELGVLEFGLKNREISSVTLFLRIQTEGNYKI